MDLLIPILVITLLIALNGLFVAAEFAIIGVRPSRVEQLAQEGNRTAIGIRDVVQTPRKQDRYIATAQLGITIASVGLGMYGEPVIAHELEPWLHDWFGLEGAIVHTISFLIALAIMTYLHVVVGEMVPKSLALQNAERTVLVLATPMALMQRLFSVAITVLNQIGLWVLRLLRVPPPSHGSRLHTPDELELIVSESYQGGLLASEEQQLIANIFDFSERRVSQVMTPRPRIEALPATVGEAELLARLADSPHSRLPVYDGTVDNIMGILHLKDVVRQQVNGEPFALQELLRPALFMPESQYVEEVLTRLKKSRQHMAIVMDEYGGTAGLVTLEDLIEEVVGEVRDEFDTDEAQAVTVVAPGHLVALGSVTLEDLSEYVAIGAHGYDVETVGGLVLAELNRRPRVGDEVTVNGVRLRVEAIVGLAVERLAIHFAPPAESPPAV